MPVRCKCVVCGKEFFVKPSRIVCGGGKHCSKGCFDNDQRKGEVLKCVKCGKEFYRPPSSKKVYCSKSCAAGDPPVKKTCKVCGKEFYIDSCWAKAGRGIYCSAKCYDKNKKGAGNPRWLGGKSFEPYCNRFDEGFKEAVRVAFDRKCYICAKLEANKKHAIHHIDYNKNSICNGNHWAFLPLCHSHHSATNNHRWYWFNLLIYYWAMNPEINIGAANDIYPHCMDGAFNDKRRKINRFR